MVQFYRKTEIVNDTGLFQAYPDLFMGQEDTIEIKGGTTGRRGVFEFIVADSPVFGDAVLTAIRPNFYISSVDLNDTVELPRYKGYVFNKSLSDLSSPEGGLGIKNETAVVIETYMSNDGAWLEEKFDGNPRQIGGDIPELEVESGTVIRTIDRAISVTNLIKWLRLDAITGGDGKSPSGGVVGWLKKVFDEAEYSDDFDEYLEQGDTALELWLNTSYGIPSDNMQFRGTKSQGWWNQSIHGSGAEALSGAYAGGVAGTAIPIPFLGTGTGAVIGAAAGAAMSNPDNFVKNGSLTNDSAAGNYIVPIEHEKRRGRKDYYRPKKYGTSPNWWIHSKDIDRSGFLMKDVKMTRSVESDIDVNMRIHPGNSVFDLVRRQKSYWIADPEDYAGVIEAAYTRALFTTSNGLDGQAAQLKAHWRHIDSAEVSDRALMVPVKANPAIDNRQELIMSYGHIPRPNERDVYHAGTFDVYPQGVSATTGNWGGYASGDNTSKNTMIYEKMLDSKVATKVSFTFNPLDLEYAWVEPALSGGHGSGGPSVKPSTSSNGIITSRRGFFATLSRNPVKQGKAGERAQTFVDYLTDNMTNVTDNNTTLISKPGTFVLGFLNFPTDKTCHATANNTTDDAVNGYIHKERQNKISVVWHDYWTSGFAPATDTKTIGWLLSGANPAYQGHDGVAASGFYDVVWEGLANHISDQPTDDIVLLDGDTWYTVDMYMHPKVPCIRVHITDVGTGKRVDNNKILMWPGPNATATVESIRTPANKGTSKHSRLGDESRWPAYCTFWLNNTHWKSTNESVSAEAGYNTVTGGATSPADEVNQIDIFTGGATVDGTHAESEILLDNFNIYNINTTKNYSTISKNNVTGSASRLSTSSYSEVEALYRPLYYHMDSVTSAGSYVQEIDESSGYSGDAVVAFDVADGGLGYDEPPIVVLGSSSGTGAVASVTTADDGNGGLKVTAIGVTTGGSGYKYPPMVNIVHQGEVPTRAARAKAIIGASAHTREVVKAIPAPRYVSIGFDDKPADMYTLYGNTAATSTTTKVVGDTDYGEDASVTSFMAYNASGSTIMYYLDGKRNEATTMTQVNPQTAAFASTTDNELVGGKLKIHYADLRAGDCGSQTAVRDIVAASNTATVDSAITAYVEVWPPLPTAPDAADNWEIQTRSHVLFSDLITRQINDLTQMYGIPYDYARGGHELDNGTPTNVPSRGVFNLGWNDDMADVEGEVTPAPDVRTISGSGDQGAPAGTIHHAYYENVSHGGAYAKIGKQSSAGRNPVLADPVLTCIKNYGGLNDSTTMAAPTGFRRTFDSPIDLSNCDIMIIVNCPGEAGLNGGSSSYTDIDADAGTGAVFGQLEALFGPGPDTGVSIGGYYGRGAEFGASLRLMCKGANGSDEVWLPNPTSHSIGAWCAHKNLFMKESDDDVYKRDAAGSLTKSPANNHWIKLVFPTADTDRGSTSDNASVAWMEGIEAIEFAVNFDKRGTTGYGSGGAEQDAVVWIAGIYAIPRGAADVMAGFSNSQNAIGELSKETFLPVKSTARFDDSGATGGNLFTNIPPDSSRDGLAGAHTGLASSRTPPKFAGLTVGGKGKMWTGVRAAAAIDDDDTSLTIDAMTPAATPYAIHVDDRIMLGTSTEVMRVKTVSTSPADTITLERGADGTTAMAHLDNDLIFVITPSDAEVLIKDYDFSVDGFSQKGFISLGFTGSSGNRLEDGISWQKRENPLVSTRIIEIVSQSEQGTSVRIDQPDIFNCENDSNSTFILYKEDSRAVSGVETDSPTAISLTGESTTFIFDRKKLSGDVLTISRSDFFSEMPDETSVDIPKMNYFISPYKYWLYLRFLPKVKGNSGYPVIDYGRFSGPEPMDFPKRSYKSLVVTETPYKGLSGLHLTANETSTAAYKTLSPKDVGPTWKESVFTDGKYLNSWQMDYAALRPVFEQSQDYGFGVFSEETPEQGQCFENNALVGWNENILPNVVNVNTLKPGSKISFMITPQDNTQGYSISINSQENSSNSPYLITTYFDALSLIDAFKILPDEENPMFPQFTWGISGSDLWYGFIKIGTDAIYGQYHNKELHIPMNESTTATLTVDSSTTTYTIADRVLPSNLTMTREGLAGYAVDFNGTNSYLRYGVTPDITLPAAEQIQPDPTPNCTTYMSVIAHCVPDSGATDNRYIISQEGALAEKFYIRLNSTNQVEARVWYSANGYVDLSSGAIVASDGETPAVIILTVDTTVMEGNVKLYVNGKLEDQTGLVDSSGTVNNWKINTALHSLGAESLSGGYLMIGNSGSASSNTSDAFDGKIEEIVIYKDLIYPVDVKSGKYTLTKPLKEITSSGRRLSYNAVLFIKDYHNIRGTKPEDVARTEQLTFSKSGPAVIGD